MAGTFDHLSVTVESIDGNMATVLDSFRVVRQLRVDHRRGSGPKPRIGEEWRITRSMGHWTFDTVLRSIPPLITASTAGVPAMATLLAVLDAEGLIENQSTADSTSVWDTGWNNVGPLQNFWLGTAYYRKITSGLVLLRGALTPDPPPEPFTPLPSVAFTLPANSRPGVSTTVLAATSTGAIPVTVATNGNVTLSAACVLDPISFLAEP